MSTACFYPEGLTFDIDYNIVLNNIKLWRLMKTNIPIDLNPQFKKALELMEHTSKNIFITGKAGTGKSTLLDYFRSITKKKIVVLAPTGVAALNVLGETIHSFFGFKPDITAHKIKRLSDKKSKIYKSLDTIIIDEISMVRADLLDCVDKFLRLNRKNADIPFGGIQMVFIGDLYQLPPVIRSREREIFKIQYKNAYFFESSVFAGFSFEFVELEKIYRQRDERFIEILNAIRNNSVTDEHFSLLNRRAAVALPEHNSEFFIYLTTTNISAAKVNEERLSALRAKTHSYKAKVTGRFQKNAYPADEQLKVAVESQIMLLNNDPKGRWVNGSIGKVVNIKYGKEEDDIIYVKFTGGAVEKVLPISWEIFHFSFNERQNRVETENLGSFTQYPLKLAWAVTIHKSQGKTFDRVVVDMGAGAFACGQTYVALSRCTSLEGVFLKRPVRKSDIRVDYNIMKFLTGCQYAISENEMPLVKKIEIIKQAIEEKKSLNITYLKADDTKSQRIIVPYFVGQKTYKDKEFIGVEAYCGKQNENRTFRVDRILEIDVSDNKIGNSSAL